MKYTTAWYIESKLYFGRLSVAHQINISWIESCDMCQWTAGILLLTANSWIISAYAWNEGRYQMDGCTDYRLTWTIFSLALKLFRSKIILSRKKHASSLGRIPYSLIQSEIRLVTDTKFSSSLILDLFTCTATRIRISNLIHFLSQKIR